MSQPQRRAVEWVSKRGGEIVAFDLDRLTQSIARAAAHSAHQASLDKSTELAEMIRFFIETNVEAEVTRSEDIAEWTIRCLQETGHELIAEAYTSYLDKKRKLLGAELSDPWNKAVLVKTLQSQLGIDDELARSIAASVERALIRLDPPKSSQTLVGELVNLELDSRQMDQLWVAPEELRIQVGAIREALEAGGVVAAEKTIRQRIWRGFSENQILAFDVVQTQRGGLLDFHCLKSPGRLAATSIRCDQFARKTESFNDALDLFALTVSKAVAQCSELVSLELVEPWVASSSGHDRSPSELVKGIWTTLTGLLQNSDTCVVLNLSGGLSDAHFLGAGPLFDQEPDERLDEMAADTAEEFLGLFHRDAVEHPRLSIDWQWNADHPIPVGVQRRMLRMAAESLPWGVTFPRRERSIGEGLNTSSAAIPRPVLDYVTIDVLSAWNQLGKPKSLGKLQRHLTVLVGHLVRGAVQHREFIRRVQHSLAPALIDQATLVVCPRGLDRVVSGITSASFADEPAALAAAQSIVRSLTDSLAEQCRPFGFEFSIDHYPRELRDQTTQSGQPTGLLPTMSNRGPRHQIHAAGCLHQQTNAGTMICHLQTSTPRPLRGLVLQTLSDGAAPQLTNEPGISSQMNHENVNELLNWVGRSTDLVRLAFRARPRPVTSQQVVPWPEQP